MNHKTLAWAWGLRGAWPPGLCQLQAAARTVAAALLLMAGWGSARAQLMDDLVLRRDGADAVLQIRMVSPVQFLRAWTAPSGDQTLVVYRLLPTQQAAADAGSERKLQPGTGSGMGSSKLPTLSVTEEPANGRNVNERRLVVRLSNATKHRARAGRGDRTIEVVLEGLGPLVVVAGATPQAPATTPLTPPSTPASTAASTGAVAAASTMAAPPDADLERRAATLLASAQAQLAAAEPKAAQAAQAAVDTLGQLLDLPPNRSSREAQALIGRARLQAGDSGRARAEFEAFLRLYPTGADSDQVRAELARLSGQNPAVVAASGAPAGAAATGGIQPVVGARPLPSTTTLTGSVSSFYYGGQSKVRTQEFQESALGGLPQLVSDATLSDTDQRQLISSADINWRHRDADVEQRFVFRDTYNKDFKRPDKSRNKLSALYFDQRSFKNGTSFRLGRQTPLGGGVLGRFDGAQASLTIKPQWKASMVAGVPTDSLLDTKRYFYGLSVDAEAITPKLGGSLYAIQQEIDRLVDRSALGSELRYFDGGVSVSGQLDYDLKLKGLNIASMQGTWQRADNTVFNLLLDHRKAPMLMLGNALFFSGVAAARVSDLINAGATAATLRQQVRDTTANSTQAALGVTTPVSPKWQLGADVRYTNTGAISPVPDLLPQGQPSTGDIWSLGLQAIGTNLYSARDTHVVIANTINGATFKGQLLSYNNSSALGPDLQLEPSLKLYRQVSTDSVTSTRWAPGLRVTWRYKQEVALESEVSVENSKTTGPTRNESSTRTYYYLGGRYEF